MNLDLTQLVTESRNPASADIDTLSTLEMLQVINHEDQLVALAVEKTLPQIAASGGCHYLGISSGWTFDLHGSGNLRSLGDFRC